MALAVVDLPEVHLVRSDLHHRKVLAMLVDEFAIVWFVSN